MVIFVLIVLKRRMSRPLSVANNNGMYFITTNEDEVAIFLVWVLLLREMPAQPPPVESWLNCQSIPVTKSSFNDMNA